METFVVYAIRSKETGECYIGATIRPALRKSAHFSHLKTRCHTCRKLQAIYNQRGVGDLEWVVIEEVAITVMGPWLKKAMADAEIYQMLMQEYRQPGSLLTYPTPYSGGPSLKFRGEVSGENPYPQIASRLVFMEEAIDPVVEEKMKWYCREEKISRAQAITRFLSIGIARERALILRDGIDARRKEIKSKKK